MVALASFWVPRVFTLWAMVLQGNRQWQSQESPQVDLFIYVFSSPDTNLFYSAAGSASFGVFTVGSSPTTRWTTCFQSHDCEWCDARLWLLLQPSSERGKGFSFATGWQMHHLKSVLPPSLLCRRVTSSPKLLNIINRVHHSSLWKALQWVCWIILPDKCFLRENPTNAAVNTRGGFYPAHFCGRKFVSAPRLIRYLP